MIKNKVYLKFLIQRLFKSYEKFKKSIDFYYYDGEHSYKNHFENLILAKEFFRSGTIILVEDRSR